MPDLISRAATSAQKSLVPAVQQIHSSNDGVVGGIRQAKTGVAELTEFVNSVNKLMEQPMIKMALERVLPAIGTPSQGDGMARGTAPNYRPPAGAYARPGPPAIGDASQDIEERMQMQGTRYARQPQAQEARAQISAPIKESDEIQLEKAYKGILTSLQFIGGQIGKEKSVEDAILWWQQNEIDLKNLIAVQLGLQYNPPSMKEGVDPKEGEKQTP